MRFSDLLRLVLENLNRRIGRVLMTALGVVIGTASVVLLVSLASGLRQSATSNLYGVEDLSRITVNPGYGPVMKVEGGGGGMYEEYTETAKLTPDALEQIAALPGVAAVIPMDYLQAQANMRFGKFESGYAGITGIDSDKVAYMGFNLAEGEASLRRGTVILGGQAVNNFWDPSYRPGQTPPETPDLMGQKIRMTLIKWSMDGEEIKKTVDLQVIGILETTNGPDDWQIFADLGEVTRWNEWAMGGQRINRNRDGYNNVVVKAEDPKYVVDLTDQINEMGFQAYSSQTMVEGINSYFMILQLVFGGIGAIALFVAAIGIVNTMTMAILERTREIGLMKAVGATNRDVLSIFLGEAAGIGFLGGLGGVAIGWLGSKGLNFVIMNIVASQAAEGGYVGNVFEASTPLWLMAFGVVFATLVGFLSGLYPALRAATLEPVTALKYE
ncbi:MAG: ABC transporter permease [Anaerolineaceae bacterium]|nr:ABC transporter permease [Anaerolineaceae bacterium]